MRVRLLLVSLVMVLLLLLLLHDRPTLVQSFPRLPGLRAVSDCLPDAVAGDAPPDATADCFITVRSLGDGGTLLYEDCAVERGGAAVEGCRTRRILRRKT